MKTDTSATDRILLERIRAGIERLLAEIEHRRQMDSGAFEWTKAHGSERNFRSLPGELEGTFRVE